MVYARKRTYRKRTAPKKRTYKKRSMVSNTIKRYVNRTIHSNIENKCNQISVSQERLTTYAVVPGLLTLSMIPYTVINNGNEQGQRLGNMIKTRKCMFSFCLHQAAYNASTNASPEPQDIIMMFGKVKNARPQLPIAADFAKLYQNGNSFRAPASTTQDHTFEVNKDFFTVYKRLKFKVGTAEVFGNGAQGTKQYLANNDYKLNITKKINLTKFCPKTVKFNDTTAQPTNDGLWCWIYTVNADGSFTAQNSPALIDYTIYYEYEDA